jgi:broad specificity phosphatase PhoE
MRTMALAEAGWLRDTTRIVSSTETKAVQTAEILASALRLGVEMRPEMHENDRSATGFLPSTAFEAMANQFFADPTISVRGWERAVDAQARVLREVEQVLSQHRSGDWLLVGHGAVGTLLYCHLAGLPISRDHDQPLGGGNYFTFIRDSREILHPWRAMEEKPLF